MSTRSEIIHANPIGQELDNFRDAHASATTDEGQYDTAVDLVIAVMGVRTSRLLLSKRGQENHRDHLSKLRLAVLKNYYDGEHFKPLLDAVLNRQPDEVIWDAVYEMIPPARAISSATSYFANSTDNPKCIGAPNTTQSSKNASLLRCPFLQLPSEIRCLIYRILLLRSDRHVRMRPPPQDGDHVPKPNNLQPSILGTCRLIYKEAHYVLYGENFFHAHRISRDNHNAALIRRATYRIGMRVREEGEDDARKLADFLGFHRELRVLQLDVRFDLIEDTSIYHLIRQAIQGQRHLIDIKIYSPLAFEGIGWRHNWRLSQIPKDQALLSEWVWEN